MRSHFFQIARFLDFLHVFLFFQIAKVLEFIPSLSFSDSINFRFCSICVYTFADFSQDGETRVKLGEKCIIPKLIGF